MTLLAKVSEHLGMVMPFVQLQHSGLVKNFLQNYGVLSFLFATVPQKEAEGDYQTFESAIRHRLNLCFTFQRSNLNRNLV